jgi:hypothetical protein
VVEITDLEKNEPFAKIGILNLFQIYKTPQPVLLYPCHSAIPS